MTSSQSPATHTLLKFLVLVCIVVLPVELLSYAAGKVLAAKSLVYDPPAIENYANYLKNRDPILGWPSPSYFGKGEYDSSGSRIIPASPDPSTQSCAAIFGDSFTWGYDVTPDKAYGNVLSQMMGCRVANYGVIGYGTDQAYLRYKSMVSNNAPIVILGHFSDDITRNVNQERAFITTHTQSLIGLKPRFILERNELKLVPLPVLTEPEYLSLGSRAQELLPHDYFAPGGPSGVRSLTFPYTLSILGIIRHYRLQARIKGQPGAMQFYDPEHPSHALQITEAIITAFVNEARKRNQKPMVLLIPDIHDLRWLRDHGTLPYAELANRLRKAGVIVPEVAEKLNNGLAGRDLCDLYTECNSCTSFIFRCGAGHFNPEGNRRLAEIVYAEMKENGWISAR